MRRHSGGRRYNPLNNKIHVLLWVIIVVVVVLSAVWWQFLSRTSADTVAATRKTSSATKCAVIFDAGRSWSRVHVYCFNDALELVPIGMEMELFVQIKPGLSSFAFPREAAHSLVPLLKKATAVIPPKLRGKIPVIFGATSGLRRLGTDLENILQRVRHLLKLESSLKSQSDWTKVLNGTQEGAYQWVTINYLIGNLGKTYAHTVGVIDLRDDSVQMAYAISEEDAAKAPQVSYGQDLYVQKLSLKGTTYYLYVHSYPHYGLLAVRLEILKANKGGNNCILQGYQGTYKYGDNKYDASAASSGTSYTKCRSDVVRALKVGEPACTHVNCTFGGAWSGGGGDGQKNLFLASFFFDKAAEAGFVNRQDAVKKVKVLDLEVAAKLACKMDIKDAKATYPFVSDDNIPYLCMDLVYQFTLLVDGFGVDPYQEVSLIKKVKYGDAYVEAAWTLGSAIEVVSLS